MASYILDNSTSATDYDQTSEIGGREYVLSFHWNARAQTWFMDIADQDGNVIAGGVAIVVGIPLLRGVIDTRLWTKGMLYAVDTSGQNLDPGVADLGTRVVLVYFDGNPLT